MGQRPAGLKPLSMPSPYMIRPLIPDVWEGPRLPTDLLLGVSSNAISHQSHYQYEAHLKDTFKSAYHMNEENAAKKTKKNKRWVDFCVRYRDFKLGE